MKRSSFLIVLFPLAILLVGCVKTDTELAIDFVNTWLESRGALSKNKDGGYSPTAKGIAVGLGFGTTDDPQADAAVEAAALAKKIGETDKLVKEADEAARKGDQDTAKKKLDVAVSIRPDDWYYRNNRAYYNIRYGNGSDASKDFAAGVNGCNGNTICLDGVHRDRLNFYLSTRGESFLAADLALRDNCAIHSMAIESYQSLLGLHPGDATYTLGLQTAQQNKTTSGC